MLPPNPPHSLPDLSHHLCLKGTEKDVKKNPSASHCELIHSAHSRWRHNREPQGALSLISWVQPPLRER